MSGEWNKKRHKRVKYHLHIVIHSIQGYILHFRFYVLNYYLLESEVLSLLLYIGRMIAKQLQAMVESALKAVCPLQCWVS